MDDEQQAEQAEAMEFLGPLLAPFHEGWHGAQSTYLSYDKKHTAEHDDTTAANCVRCHMWHYIQGQMDGRAGVNLLYSRGLKLVNYYDKYLLRFKKVDKFGLHQNVHTEQQDAFDRGADIPGLPPAAIRLTSGYQLAPGAETIERVVIARVYDRSVVWASAVDVIAAEARWEDITPARFGGTSRLDARFARRGRA